MIGYGDWSAKQQERLAQKECGRNARMSGRERMKKSR